MRIEIEAIYENGVFRPRKPPVGIREREAVRLTIEDSDLLQKQAEQRIRLDPETARRIGDSHDFSLLEP
ncbi:MAG: DUF104 domain-containing protein [Planctomycetes bacterium]|nr:DUF104 domain-containing protein [Planctomycetota bacterium]